MKRITCFVFIVFLFVACNNSNDFPKLTGPYMGQELPGMRAELFAPGIISNELPNRDVAISPDGKEMYFTVHTPDFAYATIICSKEVNGVWTKPEVASFATDPRYTYLEPAMSHDGQKLFFCSRLPNDGGTRPAEEDIWFVERTEDGWSEPMNAGANINSEGAEFFPSLTQDGTLYFTRADLGTNIHYIYRSKLVNGEYTAAELLPEQINMGANRFNANVAPDESYVIIPAVGGPNSIGGVDYYVSFHNDDDTWTEPVNLGPEFNHATGGEWSASVSPDGKIIFFMATRTKKTDPEKLTYDLFFDLRQGPQNGNPDIYWVSAGIIDSFRK
jgi:WD40-like Beta Propeller Repeat